MDETADILAELEQEKSAAGGASEPATQPDAQQPQADQPWSAPDWAQFDWNGKRIAPDSADKAKTWMQQGYNYSQRAGELNKTQRELQQQRQEWDAKIKRWEEVDTYAKQNPQWWEHVEQQYNNKSQYAQSLPPEFSQALQPLQEKLGKYESFMAELQKEREQTQFRQQEDALDKEVESIRTKHSNIDLRSVDATGKTLETRIYEHATQHGIPHFRAAFYDLMSDKLLELSSANGREAAAKAQINQAKSGIIGQTPTPTKGQPKPAQNFKKKSWDEIGREAFEEISNGR